MKRYVVAFFLTVVVGLTLTVAQEKQEGPSGRKPMERDNIFAKLNLTEDQKAEMKNLRFESEKKEIELRSKLELSKLELGRLVMADAPDKSAIEKQMNEVTAAETALKMNKLNGWFEANKKLTPEQQKIWRQFLRTEVMKMAAHERKQNMREPLHP